MLPCLDEAAALPSALAALPPGWPVLVVDNGSTDDTAEVAGDLGARVVVEPRRGYGAAVHTGLAHARADLVAVLDGDGSLDAAVLPTPRRRGARRDEPTSPSAAASRPGPGCGRGTPGPGTRCRGARCGAGACRCTTSRRSGSRAGTPCSGWVSPTGPFGYPLELLLRAGRAGWRIEEMPVRYTRRAGGRSKVSGSVTGTARAVRDMGALLLTMTVSSRWFTSSARTACAASHRRGSGELRAGQATSTRRTAARSARPRPSTCRRGRPAASPPPRPRRPGTGRPVGCDAAQARDPRRARSRPPRGQVRPYEVRVRPRGGDAGRVDHADLRVAVEPREPAT